MSHLIYSDSLTGTSWPISDFSRDASGLLFVAPSNIETSTFDYSHYAIQPFASYLSGSTSAIPGYQHDVVENVEVAMPSVPSSLDHSSSGHRADLTGPYSTLNYLHNHGLAPFTSNMDHDGQTHPTTGHTEHHGDQTHHDNHHMSIVPGSPRLKYHTPAVLQDLDNDDALDHMPLVNNVADPSRGSPSPMRSRMRDDEDGGLKHLASQYLNNPGSYVTAFRVRRRRPGGHKVLIMLEIDD